MEYFLMTGIEASTGVVNPEKYMVGLTIMTSC
jgi:hypothetical protein